MTVTVDGVPYVPEAGTGKVTVPDITAGSHTVRAAFFACDVTKDGKVGTEDARCILRRAIGLSAPEIAW